MTTKTKAPAIFWVIGIIALLWNIMGVIAYLTRAFITPEMIEALPEEQRAEFLVEYPAWYTAAFALAVFCGAIGSLLLLLRKKVAYPFFIISGVAAIVQHVYLFMNIEIKSYVMPGLIILACVALILYSKKSSDEGILT